MNSIIPQVRRDEHARTEACANSFLITGFLSVASDGRTTRASTGMIVGIAAPASTPLTLPDAKETGTAFFLERREIGILTLGHRVQSASAGALFAEHARLPVHRSR